ncbi:MAG: hypothetical protein M1823_005162 [Watsoniomyces obsoletus]|nr:MAG: hypothetical protein M1823_005162 [Watsoniomyces obsoletus]
MEDAIVPEIEIPKTEVRVVLRFNTGKVPGNPLSRSFKIRDDFCRDVLGREFSEDHDFERVSPEVVSEGAVRAYMLMDLNVETKGKDLQKIPLMFIGITYNEAGKPIYYKLHSKKVADYCSIFRWGGRD